MLVRISYVYAYSSWQLLNFRFSLWKYVLNSKYAICSARTEEFIFPAHDTVSPGIMELKRIPKCTSLVVGHNGFGEFSIWYVFLFFSHHPSPPLPLALVLKGFCSQVRQLEGYILSLACRQHCMSLFLTWWFIIDRSCVTYLGFHHLVPITSNAASWHVLHLLNFSLIVIVVVVGGVFCCCCC